MPDISLSDFVDFVIKSGSPKLTKVRDLVNRPKYSPATDFWKLLREHIPHTHNMGKDLDSILSVVDGKKIRRYSYALAGYKKFLRKIGNPLYFEPPSERWVNSGLTVRVNPELGLCIAGERHVIKLYFKDEEPTPHRLDAVLELMKIAVKKGRFADVKVAVLDMSKGRLITATRDNPEFRVLLSGEAASFMTMWAALSARRDEARGASA